ncbi:unnamed protein product [Phytomonas sp. Hart1]|nr:unnamed protein product [Phytomonas sp. Hart1]|eukprot:CCW67583.1 unnamed protein product [Phytomonas sp. isolate Hart1]
MSTIDLTSVILCERPSEHLTCGLSNSFCRDEIRNTSPAKVLTTDQDEIDYSDLLLQTKDLQKVEDERDLCLRIEAKNSEEAQCRIRKAALEALQNQMHRRTKLPSSIQVEVPNREMENTSEMVIVHGPDEKVRVLPEFSIYRPGKGDLYDYDDNSKETSGDSPFSLLPWLEKFLFSFHNRSK